MEGVIITLIIAIAVIVVAAIAGACVIACKGQR